VILPLLSIHFPHRVTQAKRLSSESLSREMKSFRKNQREWNGGREGSNVGDVVVGGPRCPRCGQQPSTALPPLSPMQAGGPKLSRVTHHHSFVSLPCGPSILLSSQWMSVREALSLPPTGRLIKSVDSCGAHPPSLSVSHIDESTLKTTLFFFFFALLLWQQQPTVRSATLLVVVLAFISRHRFFYQKKKNPHLH
jgi:hypothetical protein